MYSLLISAIVVVALAQTPAPAPPSTPATDGLNLAEAALDKGTNAEARRILQTLMTGPLTPVERTRAQVLLATAHVNLGQMDDALRLADDGERLAREQNDALSLCQLERIRGLVWRDRGALLQSLEHFNRSVQQAQIAGDRRFIARGYRGLATVYQVAGDWSRVLDHTLRAMEVDPNPTDKAWSSYIVQRGIAYFELSDRDPAERDFLEALAIARRSGDRYGEAFALGELGLLYWTMDRDHTRALDHIEPAIAIASSLQGWQLEVPWLNNSGKVFRETGNPEEALRRFHRALAIERNMGGGRQLPMLYKNIGEALAHQGHEAEAESYLVKARDEADRQNQPKFRWESRMELGRLYMRRDPALAERYFTESIDLLEAEHSNVLLESFRAGALSMQLTMHDPYDEYVELLLDRGDAARAFQVAERARARAFLDTLSLAREEISAAVPPEYVRAENALLRDISTQQTALRRQTSSTAELDRARSTVEALEARLTALRLRLATDRPAVAQARYPRLWSADAFQREMLARGETLLLFYVGRGGSAVWIMRPDVLDVVRLPPREAIERAVRAYLDTIATPGTPVNRSAAAALADMLVPGLESRVPDGSRLIIIPHGILHHVPFEALADRSQRYLIEKYVVSYAPSVSSLAYLRRPPIARPRGRRVVAVGNPAALAGAPSTERAFRIDWVRDLRPLLHTSAELQQIASIFGRHARLLEREEANEVTLAQSLDGAGALHFATHALVDDEQPDRSGLALSARPPDSDGILQMREIYRMRVPAALVTLSACRTAIGRRLTGEGTFGLSRAFFYAGADTVVASLWNVNDAATAQWMGTFYQAVRDGHPVDEATRRAKLHFLRSGTTLGHPFYWAGFVATGHAATRLDVGRSPVTLAVLLALAVVAIAIGSALILKARAAKRRTVDVETV